MLHKPKPLPGILLSPSRHPARLRGWTTLQNQNPKCDNVPYPTLFLLVYQALTKLRACGFPLTLGYNPKKMLQLTNQMILNPMSASPRYM